MNKTEPPFACNMNAFTNTERNEHIEIIKEVFGAVNKIEELSDGYAFYLPVDNKIFVKTAKFIAGERQCCPFFRFEVIIEPEEELRLNLKGPEGIKSFIKAEIGRALNNSIAEKHNFTV